MQLSEIYQPIEKEMKNVAETLGKFLGESENESILKISQFLLETPGKRIRPALVLLSAKAVSNYNSLNNIPQNCFCNRINTPCLFDP
jgi:geranylgeranyl pyrophosphate synthase